MSVKARWPAVGWGRLRVAVTPWDSVPQKQSVYPVSTWAKLADKKKERRLLCGKVTVYVLYRLLVKLCEERLPTKDDLKH